MAHLRHKRDTDARPSPRIPRAALIAAPIATVATLSAVTAGVLSATPSSPDLLAQGALSGSVANAAADREAVVSRSSDRESSLETTALEAAGRLDRFQGKRQDAADAREARAKARAEARAAARATARAVANADTPRWTTAPLNLWTLPGRNAEKVGLVEEGEKVLLTGRAAAGRVELALDGRSRWVTGGYLAAEKPEPPEPEPAERGVGGACTNGTSVAGQPNIIEVHRAVCSAFPSITSYGTYRSDGEHAQGRAIDVMISGAAGWEVAEFVRAHYAELGVEYIIYSQKIWSVERSGEGWRYMSDRGSTTANHYDHVHVTTY